MISSVGMFGRAFLWWIAFLEDPGYCYGMKTFLESTPFIDWETPDIRALARRLADDAGDDEAIARACFLYVSDEIRHSWDYQLNPVTIKASEVLRHGTGFCYAKSHLLAA